MATEHGFPFFLAYGTALQGRALVEQGQVEEGIGLLRQGLASLQTAGAELARIDHLPWLAAAYARGGQVEEALAVLTEALTVVDNTGACSSEAELYRLKGELTLQKSGVRPPKSEVTNSPRSKIQGPKSSKTKFQILNPSAQCEAEACFLKAIDIARHQQAKSLELRATMSLARLRQQQVMRQVSRNKLDEAHEMLSEIYHWFTEGFETRDLQEAKALLDELSR